MGRTTRDEAASALAVGVIDIESPRGSALVLEDPRADVTEALRRMGCSVARWSRLSDEAEWPAVGGDTDWVGIRLPKARREFEMLLGIAAAALAPSGRLLVYGANDEGARSVPKRLAPHFEAPATLATGGHCRVVGALRSSGRASGAVGGRMADWRTEVEVDLGAGPRPWVSYPGVFANGRLDDGTALLLRHLPAVSGTASVLDYGAGTGFLSAGMLASCPGARVTALEPDRLAAAALGENVPDATVCAGRGWSAVAGRGPWSAIVSNPPYHHGKAETMIEIDAFLGGVGANLARGGVMRCVVQRRFAFREAAESAGLSVRAVADEGPFRVWEAVS